MKDKKIKPQGLYRLGKVVMAMGAVCTGFIASALATGAPLTLTGLDTNVNTTALDAGKITEVIVTLAGILLIIKGIVHFKQQYTSGGGGQEKHLSKGIACCVFGACLFLVLPIAHAFTGAIGGSANASWTVPSALKPGIGQEAK